MAAIRHNRKRMGRRDPGRNRVGDRLEKRRSGTLRRVAGLHGHSRARRNLELAREILEKDPKGQSC